MNVAWPESDSKIYRVGCLVPMHVDALCKPFLP